MKLALMWVTLCSLLPLFIVGTIFPITRALPPSKPSAIQLIVGCAAGIMLLVLAVYCAVSAWLLLWRHFATRREIYMIAGSGPLTRFDHWLIATLGPQE
jgi:hypothetical protein